MVPNGAVGEIRPLFPEIALSEEEETILLSQRCQGRVLTNGWEIEEADMSKVAKMLIAAAVGLLIVLCVHHDLRAKEGWKRLDYKAYSTMDDLTLLKRMVEIDDSTRKEVDAVGGESAMLAKVGGKLGDKERQGFINLVFLNDAFVEMGASHAVVTAVLDRAVHSDCLKTEMTVDDMVAVLPVVAELHEILIGIEESPIDVAEWLVDDYIDNTSDEKRAKVTRRIRKYREVGNSNFSLGVRLAQSQNFGSRR